MTDQPPKFEVQLIGGQNGLDTSFTVSHADAIQPIVQNAKMFYVQTDVSNITAELVDALQMTQRHFGIVPQGHIQKTRSPAAMQVASFDQGNTKPGALVERVERLLEAHSGSYHRLTTDEGARQLLGMESIDVLGVVGDGRQTYCNLGHLRLHPDIEDIQHNIIGPATIRSRHWFIQSCHSPFSWRDFGDYRTVPLAIMMENPYAKTVICSKRVQVRIPGLVDLYIALCLEGRPLGEVVTKLNEHVECRDMDVAPFFLIGDPSCRAFAESELEGKHLTEELSRRELLRERNMQLFFFNALTNLANITNTRNSLFHDSGKGDPRLGRARKTSRAITFERVRREVNSRGPATSLEDEWNNYPDSDVRPLQHLSEDIARSFLATGGYYYDVGPTFSMRHYVTLETKQMSYGRYRRDELDVSIGVHPDHRHRTRVHTDRDLAIADVSASLEAGLQCQGDGSDIEFSYTNLSGPAQWIFGCVFCSDPNNLSKSSSKHVYRELISALKIESGPPRAIQGIEKGPDVPRSRHPKDNQGNRERSALVFSGIELSDGETYRMPVRLILPDGVTFFYALVEAFIFVDFCWNWLSFTYRSDGIERWMSGEDYQRSIRK